jgi:integrase
MPREPGYCHHKPTNQAYVRLNGRTIYLGTYGSDESRQRYATVKAEWLAARHDRKFTATKTSGPTMAQLAVAYLDFAEGYYRDSSEYANLKLALQPVSALYPTLPCDQFGPLQYKAIREWWLSRERECFGGKYTPKDKEPTEPTVRRCSRQYINKQLKRLKRILRWGVSENMLPPAVIQAVDCVTPLKAGRCDAPESSGVTCVPTELVEATIAESTRVVADMIRFQLLTGCRPGELVQITPGMVDRTEPVWEIRLVRHKTAYRNRERTIYVGPQAQSVLMPYLLRGADDACFSPAESEKQRLEAKHARRTTPLSCGNKPGSKKLGRKPRKTPGERYTTSSYGQAIGYACKRAKIAKWSPNQLRHSAGTEIRKQFGLDAAKVILGHSEVTVTQVYAEADRQKAIEVAKLIG